MEQPADTVVRETIYSKLFGVVGHSVPENKIAKEPVKILLDTCYFGTSQSNEWFRGESLPMLTTSKVPVLR